MQVDKAAGIPRILHQTCKDRDAIPERWKAYQASWRRLHTDWTHICWDDANNEALVRDHYPQYLGLYRDLPKPINRVDLCKFLYLHRYGGFYADMDCEGLKPLDPLCGAAPIILGEKVFWGKSYVECALLGSMPGEPFWLFVIDGIERALRHPDWTRRLAGVFPSLQVIMTTGPIILERLLRSAPKAMRERIHVFPERYFFPDPTLPPPDDSYCVHYCDSTWLSGVDKSFATLQRSTLGHCALLVICALLAILLLFVITKLLRHAMRLLLPTRATRLPVPIP